MSELQAYYDAFRTGYWADSDPERCRCHGSGWACSEVDTWHQCPIHYTGQPHPEDEFGGCEPEAPAAPVVVEAVPAPVDDEEVPF